MTTTHSSERGNYSSVPRTNYTSADASRTSLGTTGRSGSGDHIPSQAGMSFATPSSNSGGRLQQEVVMKQTSPTIHQTPGGGTGGWNTNYASQLQHQNPSVVPLPKTDLKGGGTTRVSPRVYSTVLKHPQGSHQDRMVYSQGRPRPMAFGLSREAQKEQLAAKNADASWGSGGGRGGILPGLIGRVPGPPQSLTSFGSSRANFDSSMDQNSISSTTRRSSSILPASSSSLAQGDAKPYSELVSRSDKILSEVKRAIRPSSPDENFNILESTSSNTLTSTSPWDSNPSDPGIKRQKNEEYRVYLQNQIQEKEKRLQAEKRDSSGHPFGPNYESPSLPYHRQQVSTLNARAPANQAAILKKYIYENPPQPTTTKRVSSTSIPLSPAKSSTQDSMPSVKKEKQEEALRNLRQSRLKVYRNAESKEFPNNNYIIHDPHSKSNPSGDQSLPSGAFAHSNSRSDSQSHDNPNGQSYHQQNHRHDSVELGGGYSNEPNNHWDGQDRPDGYNNHHPHQRDNFPQPHSTAPTNTDNQMTQNRESHEESYQQRQFNQPQYAHPPQQQPVQQSPPPPPPAFYSPQHHPQPFQPPLVPYYPFPGAIHHPQLPHQYPPPPPNMNPYPSGGPTFHPQATSPPGMFPQMPIQQPFPPRTMQLARHEVNPSEVETHYRNKTVQEPSMVSFGEVEERRQRRLENGDNDQEISEDVVKSIAEDLKRRITNRQKSWQTSDELPDREVLTVLHKTELKQQIVEQQRQRDEQRRKEAEEDAKLERKMQEYYDECRRKDEEKQYQFQCIRQLDLDSKPSLVQISEPKNTRRVRIYESDTNLTRPKPPTPPIERYDPEITLAAKLNHNTGQGHGRPERRAVNNNDGNLPPLKDAFLHHPVKTRVPSPPVPAVYKKIASGRLDQDLFNSTTKRDPQTTSNDTGGGSEFFQQLQDYMRRERSDVERSLRQHLGEDTRRTHKGPS